MGLRNVLRPLAERRRRTGCALAASMAAATLVVGPWPAPIPGQASAQASAACPSRVGVATPQRQVIDALAESCSAAQYAKLFRTATLGVLPVDQVMDGQARPLRGPDRAVSSTIGGLWSGKSFHRRWLLNRVAGTEAGRAEVFTAASVLDGRPAIRLDYRRSVLSGMHDEIRELPNGVYIGYGFVQNRPVVAFWLWPADR